MTIPFQDFKAAYYELKPELDEAYHRFMESGYYVLGKETASFEEEYAAYCGTSYCVGVSNGLDEHHANPALEPAGAHAAIRAARRSSADSEHRPAAYPIQTVQHFI